MTAEQLKKGRRALDLTQEQLAHRFDVDRTTVARWETNQLEIPRTVELALFYLLTREGLDPLKFFS